MDISIESLSSKGSPTKKVAKPKKRSLVERELETNLTSKITSPLNNNGSPNTTSRYGRARKSKFDSENCTSSLNSSFSLKSPSPLKKVDKIFQTPKKENESPVKKYVCKDLIQTPNKSPRINSHLSNILERSSEKYALATTENNHPSTSAVVKEINFGSKKRKRKLDNKIKEEPELNDLEKACQYQIGEVCWARMGTYPFWPCLICRDPFSEVFVKMQATGKVERQYIHVIFFGDGQRSWIQENHLQKYSGLQEFLDAQKQMSPEMKKKDPKLYAAYFVSEKQQIKWKIAVEEAELLLTKTQILRLEIYNDMLIAKQSTKTTPKQNKEKAAKITRKSSDVSLSESLYDSLFSEEEPKKVEVESSKRTLKKASLDVSKVVTACLDNMAAKTGMSKIQKESHMDRWLQKAKSKTPEKVQLKKKSKNNVLETTETKETKNTELITKKKLQKNINDNNDKKNTKTPSKQEKNFKPYVKNGYGIGYITKVESLMDEKHKSILEKNVEQNLLIDNEVYLMNDDICNEVVVVEIDENKPLDDNNSEIILNGRSTPPECMISHNNSNNMDYFQIDENDLSTDEQENINVNKSISQLNISKHININTHTENDVTCKKLNKNVCSINLIEKSVIKDLGKVKINSKDDTFLGIAEENTVISVGSSSNNSCLENSKIMCDNNRNECQNMDFTQEEVVENLLDDLIIDDNIKDLKPEYDNKDFVNYVQRKKDTIMDENPDLSHREILEYLYNTWSYEYSKSGQNTKGKKVHNTRKRNDLNNKSAENIFRESEKLLTKKSPASKSSEKKSKKKQDKIKITSEERNKMVEKIQIENTRPIVLIQNDEFINNITTNENKLSNINGDKTNLVTYINTNKNEESFTNLINADQSCNKIVLKPRAVDDLINNELSKTPNSKVETLECIISDTSKTTVIDSDKEKSSKNEVINEPNNEVSKTVDSKVETLECITSDTSKTTVVIDSDNVKSSNNVVMNEVNNSNDNTEEVLLNTEVKTDENYYINSGSISIDKDNDNKSQSESIPLLEIIEIVSDTEFCKAKLDPNFLKYVDLQKDSVIDENPALSENDILLYLYKTWRYIHDENKNDSNNVNINDKIEENDLSSNINNHHKTCDLSSDVSTIYEDDNSDPCTVNDKDLIAFSLGKSNSQDCNNSKIIECDNSLDTIFGTNVPNRDINCNGFIIPDKINTYSNDPEFLEYVERKQDTIIEEHPELSETDILSYLYKTWKYEQDNFGDGKKVDYLKETSVVKDVNKIAYGKSKKNMKFKNNYKNHVKENSIENGDDINDDILFEISKTLQPTDKEIIEVKATNNWKDNIVISKNENMANGIDNSSLDVPMQTIPPESNLETGNRSYIKSLDNTQCIPEESIKNIPVGIERSQNDCNRGKLKQCYNNPHFIQYVELKQDVIIDENPDLSEEAILEYLYDTWKYEEELKTVEMKNDDLKENTLVKGLEQIEDKLSKNIKSDNILEKEQIMSNKCLVKVDSPINFSIAEENKQVNNKSDTEIIINLNSTIENEQIISEDCLVKKYTPLSVDNAENKQVKNKRDTKLVINIKKNSIKSSKSTLDTWLIHSGTQQDTVSSETTPISVLSQNKGIDINEIKKTDKTKKKKKTKAEVKTYDTEINKLSLIDFDEDIPKHVTDKSLSKYQDPEFIKYLELRQDVVIDDYPDLSMDDIIVYLYKTWSYEERLKSDERKNDDIQQSKLVKGLGETETIVPKQVTKRAYKKKAKNDKFSDSDEIEFQKDKPSRKKALKSYYNESEDFSDSDDEFLDLTKKQIETTISGGVQIEGQIFNEVEYFLHQMTLPKPNVFKGFNREKVCEICERTDNLVKCRGCSEMFHMECVSKPQKIEEDQALIKRRKKKKPRGRKPKNDSGDVSFDDNERSGEELDSIDIVINLDDFESHVEEKMKELLKAAENFDYSQYSSDDDIDWSKTVPGKCEIIDVKLKKNEKENYENFKCKNCLKYDVPLCFVCKEAVSPKNRIELRQKCNVAHCTKYYHLECLDQWPQTQLGSRDLSKNAKNSESISCPRHVCHTCVCDDPRGCKTRFSADKLAKCVRCPAVYHSFTKCLPAGTQILSASQVICPRHYELKPGKVPCHVNTGWCFICALGGTLICCEYCPTSFHAECLNIKPPEGNYMCEDCETGRLPLYGEMVWVKLGHYRWWPGLILHPSEIPDNVMAMKHYFGEFVVRFFGQYDHYWVNRGRVFPFQEGDTGKTSSQKSKIDAAFSRAIEDAYKACEVMKTAQPNEEESLDIASSLIAPHYVKLKVNKPYGSLVNWRPDDSEANSMTQCECDPNDIDPCGPDSQCLNRMLATECGPTCKAGDRCFNRNFEKRNYPKMTPYRTAHRGWGLKTLVDIKKGQFVIEYVGELIDDEEIQRRMKRKHEIRDENYYFLTLDKDRTIDAGPKGNFSRFMNHSCEPNCETQKWTVLGDVRVGLFAIQDIPANSEITFNYHFECAGMEKKQCMCGAKMCAGFMGAKVKQMEYQPKRPKTTEKTNKKPQKRSKKLSTESPSTPKLKGRPKNPIKPRELTEIEKDLLIIKTATNTPFSDTEHDKLSVQIDDMTVKNNDITVKTDNITVKTANLSPKIDNNSLKNNNTSVKNDKQSEKISVKNVETSNSLKRKRNSEVCVSSHTMYNEEFPSGKKCKVDIDPINKNLLQSLLNGV